MIGDVVNVAQRLERLTRRLDTDVVLSRDIMEASTLDPAAHQLIRADHQELTGHEGRLTVFHGRPA